MHLQNVRVFIGGRATGAAASKPLVFLRLSGVALVAVVVFSGSASALTLDVERDASEIAVRDASPGARVIILAVARIPRGHISDVVRMQAVITADGGGRASWAPRMPVPLKSVWCAVDLATGEYAVAAPSQFALVRHQLTPAAVYRRQPGEHDELQLDRATVEVLLVRPKRSAWVGRVSDGGIGDLDGRNDGTWRARFDHLRNVDGGGTEEIRNVIPGDVVITIDINELDVFAATLTEGRP